MKNTIKKLINLNNIKIVALFIYIFIVIFGSSYNYVNWGTTEFQSKFQYIVALLILFKHKYILPLLLVIDIIQFFKTDERVNLKKNVLFLVIFVIVQLTLKYFSNYEIFEEVINIVYFSRNINYKYIVSIYTVSVLAVFISMYIAYKNNSLLFENDGRGFSLGFRHSNCLGIYSCSLFIALSYLFNKRSITAILFVPTILINYYFSRSRTAFIVTILFLCLYFIFNSALKNKINNSKIFRFFFVLSPLLLSALSIAIGVMIDKGHIVTDGNFMIRFSEAVYAFNEKGLSLFANDFSDVGRQLYFDNCYIGLMFKHGIATFIIFIVLWILINISIIKEKDISFVVVALSIYVYMCMEFLIPYCFMPIFMAYLLSKKKYKI